MIPNDVALTHAKSKMSKTGACSHAQHLLHFHLVFCSSATLPVLHFAG